MSSRKHIQHYYTTSGGNVPTTGEEQIIHGEIAIDATEGQEKLLILNSSDEIVEFIDKKEVVKLINNNSGSGSSTSLSYIEIPSSSLTANIPSNSICNWVLPDDWGTYNVLIDTDNYPFGSAELLIRTSNTKPDAINFNGNIVIWENSKPIEIASNTAYRIKLTWDKDRIVYASYEAFPVYLAPKTNISLSVMSLNVKTQYMDSLNDYNTRWENRGGALLQFITGNMSNVDGYVAPMCDIIGLQEVSTSTDQLNNIEYVLKDANYNTIVAARGNTSALIQDSEACVIAYRSDKFERVSGGYFWLRGGGWNGDTGDFNQEGYSRWDAQYQDNGTYEIKKRIAVWIILREITTGKEIFVLNTHYNQYFNSEGTAMSTPYYSSEIVKNRIEALSGGRPVILLGDLHCNPDKSAIAILKPTYYKLLDTRDVAEGVIGMKYTMNSWEDEEVSPTHALFDYILTTDDFKVKTHITPNAKVGEFFISDHNPVIADMTLSV